ncbi:hypothetical protein PCANC_19063 [Puccinia coronata f. sp. avenae]|uniref:Uncharacterized protein n=1 Tax=Puccinia coronata f. sp. avenae TaxID=200324 RepID=A0A2N5UCZ4_9BASI|nr:hypothetical protein PCANC_19063 [Puccinia coronata f. sp. avenae]PLW43943.1 hypothetical protein PCASD_06479 [Puccinia coronata f. sp. avenae]
MKINAPNNASELNELIEPLVPLPFDVPNASQTQESWLAPSIPNSNHQPAFKLFFEPTPSGLPSQTQSQELEKDPSLLRGLIAARPKGVRTPPRTPTKKACGGCTPSHTGVQTPARPPPHAARRPHAYKWREDGRLGVRPRRTGVLAMHACPEGVQALHALRTGVHGRHACPARLT